MYHKDFAWGKGVWVWQLQSCLGGNIDAIIKKCHDYDISYLLIKNGDGTNFWSQLTHDVVAKFQSAGIKVYSWTYNYGYDPVGEANVAIKCLALGVNGHVFDAESEYERLPNNAHAAEVMLQAVRARYPDKFLAHAPYPIIKKHSGFPYVTFGKYCDAVMPQVYWGTMGRTPQDATMWMYQNFVEWEAQCRAKGQADSIKPIIPIGQAYDNYSITPGYTETPADILAFGAIVKGYKSYNFWSFQHLQRNDCWEAIRNAEIDKPSDADRGITRPVEQAPAQPATPQPSIEQPAQEEAIQPAPQEPVVETQPVTVTTPETPIVQEVQSDDTTVTVVEVPPSTTTVVPAEKPQTVSVPSTINVPVTEKTTITVNPDPKHPDGARITVKVHRTHQDYFVDFLRYLVSLFKRK